MSACLPTSIGKGARYAYFLSKLANPPKEVEVERGESKIDQDLMRALDKLADTDEIDVLLYPKQMGEDFERFLLTKKNQGMLDYNILQLANCVVIKAPKKVIQEIAARNDVSRITMNPRFTIH